MSDEGIVQLVLLAVFIILMILFVLTQQRILEATSTENRLMHPKLVWIQLIPVLGQIWSFVVVHKISHSILSELTTTTSDSVFGDEPLLLNTRPSYNAGIAFSIFFCLSLLPLSFFTLISSLTAIVLWFVYWYQLIQFRIKIDDRAMLMQRSN